MVLFHSQGIVTEDGQYRDSDDSNHDLAFGIEEGQYRDSDRSNHDLDFDMLSSVKVTFLEIYYCLCYLKLFHACQSVPC